jgi:hypothetical protein
MKLKRFIELIENLKVEHDGVKITLDDHNQETILFKNLEVDSDNTKIYDEKNSNEYNIDYIVFVEGIKEVTAKVDYIHL